MARPFIKVMLSEKKAAAYIANMLTSVVLLVVPLFEPIRIPVEFQEIGYVLNSMKSLLYLRPQSPEQSESNEKKAPLSETPGRIATTLSNNHNDFRTDYSCFH
jgi:hypothetical protein